MTPTAFALVLTAAVLHAVWNAVVKDSSDRLVAAWAVTVGAGLINIPVVFALGLPEREALGWLALSAVLHTGYVLALAGAYDRANLSVAYPIARGSAPLIVAVGGIVLLDDHISTLGLLGILVVVAGIVSIGLREAPSGVGWALLTGVMIASYTLSDGAGVRAGDESVRYIAALFVVHATALTAILSALRPRQDVISAVRRSPRTMLLAGPASALAYLLVMIAARTTPLGLVSALRESSVVIGMLIGVVILKEHVRRPQAIGVVMAMCGVVLLALG